MSWGRDGSRRGYNLRRDDGVSFHDRDGWRENAPHEASERTEVEQVHIIRTQVLGVDPEALELALDLIRPGIAARRPLVGVSAWPPALARRVRFAAGLEPRGTEPRDAAARFGALAPHVEAVVDAPA